ncbi:MULTISPECIES: YveK family protein [Lysinibacillus]|uniref:Capsular biosynthesis protein n=1 Tax=Lysinibacillus fusiformis TaxID=28031 RepID=A0A2I0V4I2_9BACI|nr:MULTISPECIES: Wzz/FepE/Etk N-terminal domain-containing protein [Lysinibacillus]MEE3807097.1 Wzz/FepE/Etk N-terminal domain-containing protein [Lysinibacillus fusiformis]PKU53200.1 capsular biosynthesis protein [Lysinibacillus fusiformis]SCX86910.1 Capsular polysaccharide biosynthesis protein [Lysinibacillus sp. SG9]SDB05278.1 Capsular polysaccharide biosynthesis protein [Lysinibacillus sp. TC-37]SFS35369.1 Capsular polysaccharide biosynthesis protein [Lysinibacillus sp. SG55]
MNEEMTIQSLIKVLLKRWFFILMLMLLSMGIAILISYYIQTPIYEAETQLLVNQKSYENQQLVGAQNVDTDLRLINTYNVIIKSPVILAKVIDVLSLDTTPDELMKQIEVSSANNSQVVNIRVQDKNEENAVKIANSIAEVFKEEIPVLMHVDNINILFVAQSSEQPVPVKPNKMLNLIIAAICGFALAIVLAYFLETIDRTIKTEQDIEEILSLPVIGVVSNIELQTRKKLRVRGPS